jgi:hypothetical protein
MVLASPQKPIGIFRDEFRLVALAISSATAAPTHLDHAGLNRFGVNA